MPVWKCPHCTSVQIIVGDRPIDEVCPKFRCGGILDKLHEPDAGNAVFDALYGGASIASQIEGARAFNASLKRFLETLEAQS